MKPVAGRQQEILGKVLLFLKFKPVLFVGYKNLSIPLQLRR
jgi:hypothetical protein